MIEEEEDVVDVTNVNLEVQSFHVKKQLAENVVTPIPKPIKTKTVTQALNFHPFKDYVALGSMDGSVHMYEKKNMIHFR